MGLLGMPEAAKRLELANGSNAQRALKAAGVPLVRINERAMAVEEADLQRFIDERRQSGYTGRGRPAKERPTS